MADKRKSAAWRDYQEKAAELFRAMGFRAVVEEAIDGARGRHKVDVVARTRLGGVEVTWIVECKCWNASVPKAHVLTLVQVAQDVGADRAVLLSETGFQAGAVAVARKSNVLLTSLAELEGTAADSIAELSIRRSLEATKALEAGLHTIMFDFGPRTPPPPELEETISLLGACLEVTWAGVAVQAGRFPVTLPMMFHDETRRSDDLPEIAAFLAADVADIAARKLALVPKIAAMLKPFVETGQALVERVGDLMAAAERLLPAADIQGNEDAELMEVLAAMKAVGAAAETLRTAPSEVLTEAVKRLMRTLIDGIYLWVSDQDRTADSWRELTAETKDALNAVSAAIHVVELACS